MAKPSVSKNLYGLKKEKNIILNQIKFTPKNLYRHEQFGTPKTEAAAPPPQQAIQAGPSKPLAIESRITYQPPQPQNKRPVTTPPQQQVQAEQKVEAARQSLMEPIIPEDSYSYGKLLF